MIRCFVVMCMVSQPNVCSEPRDITPVDHAVTSPMECMRGGQIYFSQPRMAQQTPEDATAAPAWFPKAYSRLEGDGSDIIRAWVAEQKAKAAMQDLLEVK